MPNALRNITGKINSHSLLILRCKVNLFSISQIDRTPITKPFHANEKIKARSNQRGTSLFIPK